MYMLDLIAYVGMNSLFITVILELDLNNNSPVWSRHMVNRLVSGEWKLCETTQVDCKTQSVCEKEHSKDVMIVCVCYYVLSSFRGWPLSILNHTRVHANDYPTKPEVLKWIRVSSRTGWVVHVEVNISEEGFVISTTDISCCVFLQTVKTGEAAVRGTMEPVSKSKSIRVCVMVLTLLVEEPVPIWCSWSLWR